MPWFLLSFILLLLLQLPHSVSPACPHNCNGHGDCISPSSRCSCWPQNEALGTYWKGADCSLQGCASGRSWHDAAISDDIGHQVTECSSRGNCDYGKGVCTCQDGFEGRACERLSCPNGCAGHGTCVSLESLAHHQYMDYNFNWDHDKLYGCQCDARFTGYDCSLHMCPYGDDPVSGTQEDEVQTISCKGSGRYELLFKGEKTRHLPSTATTEDVRRALEELKSLGSVSVSVPNDGSKVGMMLCTPLDGYLHIGPSGEFSITFTHDPGDQPLLIIKPYGELTMSVEETVPGTKEWLECSGRGLCDRSTGDCECFDPFSSSNGSGEPGTRGDCGYVNSNPWMESPVQFTQKKLNDALGNGFSVSRPFIPKTTEEQIAYEAALFAGSQPNNLLSHERSSKGRLDSCANNCNGNGACGTFTGTALSYQVADHPTKVTMKKTEPEAKGDVPSVYTQPETDGLPSIRRRAMETEKTVEKEGRGRNLDGVVHNMILVTDRALIRHATLSQKIQIEGITKSLVDRNPALLKAVLGTIFGISALEIELAQVKTAVSGKLYVDVRVKIAGLETDEVETKMRATKVFMEQAETTSSVRSTMATSLEAAYSLSPSTVSVVLTAPKLDTVDTSPEIFAALALGGAKFDCGTCQCKCGDKFSGGDCSRRTCPIGRSWFSLPTLANFAHSPATKVPCSDAGICDELRGVCECRKGFDGEACERLACPKYNEKQCNGHGECLSMRMTAERHSIDSDAREVMYGKDPNNGDAWDADSVYGCYCDSGFTGYDCSIRACDRGDDPRTTQQVYEKQVFRCVHAGSAPPDGISVSALDIAGTKVVVQTPDADAASSGAVFFRLTFRGQETRRIKPDASPSDLQAALEEITTIGRVSVTFQTSSTVCASSAGSVVVVEFKTETGGSPFADLTTREHIPSPPPLRAGDEVVSVVLTFAEDLTPQSIGGVANVNSTRESNVCADRGTCNSNTGECECFDGYKRGSNHGTGACDVIESHTALRRDGIPLWRKNSFEFRGT